ncbi:MAG: cell division protein FtsW, partial [Chlamydiia bacterium]|nr:cell division protein FtsW [Chlamydiia bacterium]
MPSPRVTLPICVTTIFALGLVMIFNASSAEVLDHALERSTHFALFRQLLYAVVGSVLAYGCWQLGYRGLLALSAPMLILTCVLLVLVFVPGFSWAANGARRWVRIAGGYTLQPSEFIKYILPLYCIHHMEVWKDARWSRPSLKRLACAVLIPILLIGLEPDNGTVGIVLMTLMVLAGLYRIPAKYWAAPFLALVLIAGTAAYQLPYVSGRIQVFLHPELDLLGRGHQPHQARIAAGSGGVWGKGPGKSLQKLSYLPEAQNDYIAAIYAEEFGFVGVVFLVTLYMAMTYLGLHIGASAKDAMGFYLASIFTFVLSIQAFLNLGVVSGLLPSTGLNLP